MRLALVCAVLSAALIQCTATRSLRTATGSRSRPSDPHQPSVPWASLSPSELGTYPPPLVPWLHSSPKWAERTAEKPSDTFHPTDSFAAWTARFTAAWQPAAQNLRDARQRWDTDKVACQGRFSNSRRGDLSTSGSADLFKLSQVIECATANPLELPPQAWPQLERLWVGNFGEEVNVRKDLDEAAEGIVHILLDGSLGPPSCKAGAQDHGEAADAAVLFGRVYDSLQEDDMLSNALRHLSQIEPTRGVRSRPPLLEGTTGARLLAAALLHFASDGAFEGLVTVKTDLKGAETALPVVSDMERSHTLSYMRGSVLHCLAQGEGAFPLTALEVLKRTAQHMAHDSLKSFRELLRRRMLSKYIDAFFHGSSSVAMLESKFEELHASVVASQSKFAAEVSHAIADSLASAWALCEHAWNTAAALAALAPELFDDPVPTGLSEQEITQLAHQKAEFLKGLAVTAADGVTTVGETVADQIFMASSRSASLPPVRFVLSLLTRAGESMGTGLAVLQFATPLSLILRGVIQLMSFHPALVATYNKIAVGTKFVLAAVVSGVTVASLFVPGINLAVVATALVAGVIASVVDIFVRSTCQIRAEQLGLDPLVGPFTKRNAHTWVTANLGDSSCKQALTSPESESNPLASIFLHEQLTSAAAGVLAKGALNLIANEAPLTLFRCLAAHEASDVARGAVRAKQRMLGFRPPQSKDQCPGHEMFAAVVASVGLSSVEWGTWRQANDDMLELLSKCTDLTSSSRSDARSFVETGCECGTVPDTCEVDSVVPREGCVNLAALSSATVEQLIASLMKWAVTDTDRGAMLKLLKCRPLSERAQLLNPLRIPAPLVSYEEVSTSMGRFYGAAEHAQEFKRCVPVHLHAAAASDVLAEAWLGQLFPFNDKTTPFTYQTCWRLRTIASGDSTAYGAVLAQFSNTGWEVWKRSAHSRALRVMLECAAADLFLHHGAPEEVQLMVQDKVIRRFDRIFTGARMILPDLFRALTDPEDLSAVVNDLLLGKLGLSTAMPFQLLVAQAAEAAPGKQVAPAPRALVPTPAPSPPQPVTLTMKDLDPSNVNALYKDSDGAARVLMADVYGFEGDFNNCAFCLAYLAFSISDLTPLCNPELSPALAMFAHFPSFAFKRESLAKAPRVFGKAGFSRDDEKCGVVTVDKCFVRPGNDQGYVYLAAGKSCACKSESDDPAQVQMECTVPCQKDWKHQCPMGQGSLSSSCQCRCYNYVAYTRWRVDPEVMNPVYMADVQREQWLANVPPVCSGDLEVLKEETTSPPPPMTPKPPSGPRVGSPPVGRRV